MGAVVQSQPRTEAEEYALSWAEPADPAARCVIYLIVCWANGKGYVGQTRAALGSRYRAHQLSSFNSFDQHLFARSMRKYGIDKFSMFIIEHSLSIDLDDREKYWIKTLNTLSPNGYNLKIGGGVDGWLAAEVGEKISVALQGRRLTAEHKANISAGVTGTTKTMTTEWRNNIGLASRGRKQSEETKRKRAKSLKGNIWITDGITARLIRFNEPMPEGWLPGCGPSMKFKLTGQRWINDGVVSKRIKKGEKLLEGWKFGVSSKIKSKLSGKLWISNGINTKKIQIGEKVPKGWHMGRK